MKVITWLAILLLFMGEILLALTVSMQAETINNLTNALILFNQILMK